MTERDGGSAPGQLGPYTRPDRVDRSALPPPVGLDALSVLAVGLDHPEAVAVGVDGALYAGGEAGQIYRIDARTGTFDVLADVGRFILGLCVDAAGHVYACAEDVIVRVDPRDGSHELYCAGTDGGPMALTNGIAFERDGHLLVSDSGDHGTSGRPGRIVRIPPGGGTGEILPLPILAFPNGIAVDDDRGLFITESGTQRVLLLRPDGRLDVFADTSAGVIDGVALDTDGGLVLSYFQPNLLDYLDRAGRRTTLAQDPTGLTLLTPTNTAFCGPDRRTLAIASLCGWSVLTRTMPHAGRALNRPEIGFGR